MKIQNTLNRFDRYFGRGVDRSPTSEVVEEQLRTEIWKLINPTLDRGLTVYEKGVSAATPESTLNPLRDSKMSCQRDLEKILDKLLDVLGLCAATEYRNRIRGLQASNVSSRARIGEFRRQLLSAPAEKSLNALEGIWTQSSEGLQEQIDLETDAIASREQRIDSSKLRFREHLSELGVEVSAQTSDSFLLPIEDDIVMMAAVISNIKQLTIELERLVDQRREDLSDAMRYYGVYVLLVLALDRLEKQFVRKVDEEFLPRLKGLISEASRITADARDQISKGGPKPILLANIETNKQTSGGCELFAKVLESQRSTILARNAETQRVLGAAVNTYRTVRIATDVRRVIGDCQTAFKALRELSLPSLKTFQNIQLNEELQRLAERLAVKE